MELRVRIIPRLNAAEGQKHTLTFEEYMPLKEVDPILRPLAP